MDEENPIFGFGLDYGGKLVHCEAIMKHNSYDILFDGRSMGSVAYTEDFTWMQASGVPLPQVIIDEIGFRIESQFK